MDAPKTSFSVSEAARVAGVARSTLHRAIKAGRLSQQPDGKIDAAELHRVYPLRSASGDATTHAATQTRQGATVNATHEQRLEQRALELERERDRLRQELDETKERERRLLGVVESQQRVLEAGRNHRGVRDRMRSWWRGS